MDWNLLIKNIGEWLSDTNIRTFSPTTSEEICDAESKLSVKFPKELIDYLKYSNGIEQFMKHPQSNEIMPIDDVIWSVQRIVKETLALYTYMNKINAKFTYKCIFIVDNGCGESFCYKFNEDIGNTSIYVYYLIENEFVKIASSFEEWVTGWFSGNIST